MTYRISYNEGWTAAAGARGHQGVTRTEYFRSKDEALKRARELLDDGDRRGVSMSEGDGSVLTGILLQLKLGMSMAD
jgi:hypothetical protein